MADEIERKEQNKPDNIHSNFLFKEIYFLSLASQSNIYCCVKLESDFSGSEKLLVGSLGGKVSCIDSRERCKPNANEIYFTYIPGDAEIISMDAISRGQELPRIGSVIAISLVLVKVINGNKKYQHFINFYTAMEPEKNDKLTDIARSCQHIELHFTPYQLTHANILSSEKGGRPVFLLSGSDKKVHMFKEDKELQRFVEFPCEQFFPEFRDLPSSITWMDVKEMVDNKRITAFGCQDGYLFLAIVNSNSEILQSFATNLEGPISSVCLFTLNARDNPTEIFKPDQTDFQETSPKGNTTKIPRVDLKILRFLKSFACLLQVQWGFRLFSCKKSFFDYVVLFISHSSEFQLIDVVKQGFSNMAILPRSDHFDCVTCSLVADFDLDGKNEVILGTYGQELLVYKFHPSSLENGMLHFELQWTKTFPKPIFRVEMLDVLNDGAKELIVVSLTGVHILQLEAGLAADKILENINVKFGNLLQSSEKLNKQLCSDNPD
eukprot:gene20046-22013_t